jgi:hypothetical protein
MEQLIGRPLKPLDEGLMDTISYFRQRAQES